MRQLVSVIITVILVSFVKITKGQEYVFKVLINKNQSILKKEGSSSAIVINAGDILNRGDELTVFEGGYIGLIHKSGRTLELKSPSTNTVANLEKMVGIEPVGTVGEYTKYLADKVSKKKQSNYQHKLNETTISTRRTFGGDNEIHILIPPENAFLFKNDAIIIWDAPTSMKGNKFIVTLKNIFDEVVMKKEVTGNSVELNFSENQIQNREGLWIINVKAKNNQNIYSEDIAIRRSKNISQYKKSLINLKKEIDENGPLNKMIYVSFFEKNNLIIDALTTLEKAIKAYPKIEGFNLLKKDIIKQKVISLYEKAK